VRGRAQEAGAVPVPAARRPPALLPASWRSALEPWALLLPAVLLVGATFAYPLAELVRLSLKSSFGQGVGDSFRELVRDSTFLLALEHNGYLLLAVPILTVLAVALAIFLFEGIRGGRLYCVLVFLPITVSIPVVGGVWGLMLERNGGLNTILRSIGLDGLAQDWLGSKDLALWSVLAVIVWSQLGFGVVLFLARLLSIPPELFEAARVDGAGWWRLHRHVTLPQLKGIVQFYVLLVTITILSWIFNYVFVITGGGPAEATIVAELYVYRQGFLYNQFGLASAAALLLLAAVLVFVFVFFRLTGREETE